MNLIALVGFKGSGKDTAGRFLVENYGYQSFSFAESLKDTLATVFCWDRSMLTGDTDESRAWREQVDPWWAAKLDIPHFTPRFAMQFIGTDVFRKHFNNDLWILNIERKLTLLPEDAKVVICDGRFPNELNLARKFGGKVVRVKRGPEPVWFQVAESANGFYSYGEEIYFSNTNPAQDVVEVRRAEMENVYKVHVSEWAWIGSPLDHTIENDSTIQRLHSEVIRVCL